MRSLLTAAISIGLVGCAQGPSPAPTAPASIEMTKEAREDAQGKLGERCSKTGDLRIGMTKEEVLVICGRRPLHSVDSDKGEGKREGWAYRGTYLFFTDGKLTRIRPEQ